MLIGYITWFFKIAFTPLLWDLIYGLGLLIIVFKRKKGVEIAQYFPVNDKIATIVVIVFGLILLPQFLGNHSEAYKLSQLSGQNDDVTHFALVNSIETHKSYLYGQPDALSNEIAPYSSANPQGWHLNVALFETMVHPENHLTKVGERITFFQIATVINYLLLIYLFVYSGLMLVKKSHWFPNTLICLTVAAYIFLVKLFSLFLYGFQPQIYSIALILAIFILLVYLDKSPERESKFSIQAILLLTAGVSLGYLFLWPIALAAALLIICRYYKVKKISFLNLFSLKLLSIASFGVIQVFIYHRYFLDPNHINVQGGVVAMSIYALIAVVLLGFAYLLIESNWESEVLTVILTLSIFFTLAVGGYQLSTAGEVSYYFYKALYVVFVLASIVSIAILQKFYTTFKLNNPSSQLIVYVLLGGSVGLFMYTHLIPFNFSASYPLIDTQVAGVVATQINTNPTPKSVIFVGCLGYVGDLTATRLVMAATVSGDRYQREINADLQDEDRIMLTERFASTQPITIITSKNFLSQLKVSELTFKPHIIILPDDCHYKI